MYFGAFFYVSQLQGRAYPEPFFACWLNDGRHGAAFGLLTAMKRLVWSHAIGGCSR